MTDKRRTPTEKIGHLADMQFHRCIGPKQRGEKMPPYPRIVPRVGQARVQTATIGKAGALRHRAFTVEQRHGLSRALSS